MRTSRHRTRSQSITMHAARDTSYDDSLLQALADPREAAAYLDAVMELEDSAALTLALRQVAQAQGLKIGVLSQNRRNFRHPSSSPATSASRSIILPSLWKV